MSSSDGLPSFDQAALQSYGPQQGGEPVQGPPTGSASPPKASSVGHAAQPHTYTPVPTGNAGGAGAAATQSLGLAHGDDTEKPNPLDVAHAEFTATAEPKGKLGRACEKVKLFCKSIKLGVRAKMGNAHHESQLPKDVVSNLDPAKPAMVAQSEDFANHLRGLAGEIFDARKELTAAEAHLSKVSEHTVSSKEEIALQKTQVLEAKGKVLEAKGKVLEAEVKLSKHYREAGKIVGLSDEKVSEQVKGWLAHCADPVNDQRKSPPADKETLKAPADRETLDRITMFLNPNELEELSRNIAGFEAASQGQVPETSGTNSEAARAAAHAKKLGKEYDPAHQYVSTAGMFTKPQDATSSPASPSRGASVPEKSATKGDINIGSIAQNEVSGFKFPENSPYAGCVFTGELKDGKPDKGKVVGLKFGLGTELAGATYEGTIENGVPHGAGTLTLANGRELIGLFIKGEYKPGRS